MLWCIQCEWKKTALLCVLCVCAHTVATGSYWESILWYLCMNVIQNTELSLIRKTYFHSSCFNLLKNYGSAPLKCSSTVWALCEPAWTTAAPWLQITSLLSLHNISKCLLGKKPITLLQWNMRLLLPALSDPQLSFITTCWRGTVLDVHDDVWK